MPGRFLKTALRRILNQKLYSAISVFSLAVGLTVATLIFAFVRYEHSFDTMHPDGERTYRVTWRDTNIGSRFATFFNVLTPILDAGLDEIEAFTRIGQREHLLTVNGTSDYATLSFVDASFFDFFSYPAVEGDPAEAIRGLDGAVLTQAAAMRLFGTPDAAGHVFTVDGRRDMRVAAVVANNPANSHLGANIFVNIDNIPQMWNSPAFWENRDSDTLYHYVRLGPGMDPESVVAVALRYLESLDIDTSGRSLELQPLRAIHFTPDLQNEFSVVDDVLGTVKALRQPGDVAIFSTVAFLTLLIAALNFMNMRAVQFSHQAREIGVRRIAGSSRLALVAQLLGDTALLALGALLVALLLSEQLLPWFRSAVGAALPTEAVMSLPNIGMMAALTLAVGMAAGLYPALGAANAAPATALRGRVASGASQARVRSVLIVLQFTIAICLIAGAFIVKRQLDFAYDMPLGFEPANVVRVAINSPEARAAMPALRSELLATPGVAVVGAGATVPTASLSDGMSMTPADGGEAGRVVSRMVAVREDYFNALGMQTLAGRALSEKFATDVVPVLTPDTTQVQGGVVLNESAARLGGFTDPAQAIGARYYSSFGNIRMDLTVVGVVADAHYGSIRREVEPITFIYHAGYAPNVMIVRLTGEDNASAVAALERLWQAQVPERPIRYSYLEATWQALYEGEARTFALFIALSTLAILIACSGLYGLAAWVTERRTKEIGVRKVLGGSVWNIVLLITNDFSRLVLLANVFAWPIAWFVMDRWLQGFAYRVDLTPVVFIGSGLIALCVAWVTVGGMAAKAASAKPVLALRYE